MRRIALAPVLIVLPCLWPLLARADVQAARPWIGVGVEAGAKGVRIKQVIEGTPGEKAGLQTGDEVLSIDGTAVKEPAELIARVQDKGVGEKVTLAVTRGGKDLSITLALEAKPDDLALMRSHLLDKPAPVFDLGANAKLASLQGNVVVVEFWATWCGPCNASIPHLNDWQDKYGKKGVKILGISTEEAGVVSKFAADKKIKYTVAADGDGKVTASYFVPAIPTLVVIDKKGVVRYAGVGTGDNLTAAEATLQTLLK